MKVYFYCSYQSHPYGYQVGYYDMKPGVMDNQDLALPTFFERQNLITRLFEYGKTTEAYGLNPEDDKYFYLIKFLEGVAKDGRTLFMNFAFSFDNKDEYMNFKQNFSKEEFAKAATEFLVVDTKVDKFGFKIDSEKLDSLISKYVIDDKNAVSSLENKLYIISRSEKEYTKEIYEALHLDPSLTCHFANKVYTFSNKNAVSENNKKLYLWAGALAVALCVCISLMQPSIDVKAVNEAVASGNVVKLEKMYQQTSEKKSKYVVERKAIVKGLSKHHISGSEVKDLEKDYNRCLEFGDEFKPVRAKINAKMIELYGQNKSVEGLKKCYKNAEGIKNQIDDIKKCLHRIDNKEAKEFLKVIEKDLKTEKAKVKEKAKM